MNNGDDISKRKSNKLELLLSVILVVIVVFILVMGASHVYFKYNSKSVNLNVGKIVSNQSVAQNRLGNLSIYNSGLLPAKVGVSYKVAIQAVMLNQNIQIIGKLKSTLPIGLNLTSCYTVYNSEAFKQDATVNSVAQCIIEGIPQQSGNFLVKVAFSVQGSSDVSKDLQLVVYQ